jgi:hypothetical protein
MAMTPIAMQKIASSERCPPRICERVAYVQYIRAFIVLAPSISFQLSRPGLAVYRVIAVVSLVDLPD